jgi:hypothetical protein
VKKKKFLVVVLLTVFLVLSLVGKVSAIDPYATPPLFYLVAGSYQNLENAEAQQERLYSHRYYSRLMGYPVDGVLYWRVVVAQSKEKESLEEFKALLAEDGFEAFIAYDSANEPERPVENPELIPVPKPDSDSEINETKKFILELISWLYEMLEKY